MTYSRRLWLRRQAPQEISTLRTLNRGLHFLPQRPHGIRSGTRQWLVHNAKALRPHHLTRLPGSISRSTKSSS